MDSQFVEKVIQEVKSQGVFDDFRKDSLADVDTKPAYQNLRNRVETAVKNFLSEQKWTPELNKIQLREKLRKHITELGFLDVGVERIVDQVVNPKIATVFQPKIELIAYKYLGISPPEPPLGAPPPTPPILVPPPLPSLGQINSMLKVETSASLLPTDLEQISPDSDRATIKSDIKEDTKDDDDDLPPGVDADDGQYDDDVSPPFEPVIKRYSPIVQAGQTEIETDMQTPKKEADEHDGTNERQELLTTNLTDSRNENVFRPFDAGISQDSQLSQVSSDSRLTAMSSISGNNAEPIMKETILTSIDAVNISEEAQMPNFNENSCEVGIKKNESDLHFDIKKDAIKFEGTERKSSLSEISGGKQLTIEDAIMSEVKKNLENDMNVEEANLNAISTPNAPESSFGSCGADDTQCSVNLKTVDDDEEHKNTDGEAKENIIPKSETPRQQQELPELPDHSREELIKPSTPSSSTSSTRHNKTSSKDKRHYSDDRRKHRSRSKERESDRSRDRSSSHTHRKHSSSSSSKHSSSSGLKHSSYKSISRDKSSSTHSSSTSSSRSSNTHDSSVKRSDRRNDADRKQKSHSSKSDGKELKDSSSTSKKNDRDRQKTTVSDDHNESKNDKSQRRSSNDSNDDDKSSKSKVLNTSSISALSSPKINPNNNTDEATNGNGTQDTNGYKQASSGCHDVSKVVILNDILEQPSTDYIELTSTGKQVVKSIAIAMDKVETIVEAIEKELPKLELKYAPALESENLANTESDLLYFEENQYEFSSRLLLLQSTIDGCRSVVKSLRVECKNVDNIGEDELTKIHEEEPITKYAGIKRKSPSSAIILNNVDTCDSAKANIEATASDDFAVVANNITPQTKRLKRSVTEISPVVSDASSVSSKENEVFGKDEADPSVHQLRAKLSGGAINKLCHQQRYTNDDLYKPRPVLSQRSRRRHLNYAIP